MSTEPESFIARWSRQKRAAERDKERPAENAAPEVPAAQPVKDAPGAVALGGPGSAPEALRAPGVDSEVPLPPIESLDGLRSDYEAFFQQPVAEDIRHAALKKLFADPHFNQMDMLDVYVDDYTQFEPLPTAMKLRLASARDFLLDSERAALEAAEAPSGAVGDTGETAGAAASGDRSDSASADADGLNPANTDDASVESTQTAAPGAPPPNAQSEPEKSADGASSPVIPGKAIARDPSSS